MWSHTCWHCEISKKLFLNPTKPAKNTPLFLFPHMRHSLKIFPWGMPIHAHVFSFTHNAVVLWLFRCVHPKNQTEFFFIFSFLWIKTMSLTQDLKWSLEQSSAVQLIINFSTASNWFVTLYYIIASSVSSSSKHDRRWSSLLLYSIST